jgi:hypothetical protein
MVREIFFFEAAGADAVEVFVRLLAAAAGSVGALRLVAQVGSLLPV